MSSSACAPFMLNGACARASPRCSMTTTTRPPPRPSAKVRSPRRTARQERHRTHRRRRARPQLPEPPRRTGDPCPKHRRHRHSARPPLHGSHLPHPHPTKGLRTSGHSHRLRAVAAERNRLAVSQINGLCFVKVEGAKPRANLRAHVRERFETCVSDSEDSISQLQHRILCKCVPGVLSLLLTKA